MVARDDSVIRGSLIASLIFLVLSLALNFFLWSWGNTQATTAANAKETLSTTQGNLRQLQDQATLMKAMLGVGNITEAQFETLAQSTTGDPEMELIESQYVRDMAYFGPEVDPQNRNYAALPEFLVNAIRSRNVQYGQARDEATEIRTSADADVANARKAQQVAEADRDAANKKLEDERAQFTEDRDQMKLTTAQIRDKLTTNVQEFQSFRAQTTNQMSQVAKEVSQLENTIETQRQELNRLRSDNFESTQGKITFVMRGGNVVTINLGSADELRPGVTFGVIDGDETRLQDADVKATIQVTRIRGAHVAEARVVARPEIRNPIVEGDLIYSPFWAPGRKVKIAIAGNIDIDEDDQPDTAAIRSMINAAGAEVAAVVSPDGTVEGELDSSVRFLVVGETPEVAAGGDAAAAEQTGKALAAIGEIKDRATRLGITIIPAWKLQAYLRTVDDTVTTPLGSAVRGSDFPPDATGNNVQGVPNDLPETYRRQMEGMQRGNEILRP